MRIYTLVVVLFLALAGIAMSGCTTSGPGVDEVAKQDQQNSGEQKSDAEESDASRSQDSVKGEPADSAKTPPSAASTGESSQADVPSQVYTDKDGLKTLIAPFTPPSLEELEEKVEWVDQPLRNSLRDLEVHLKKEAQSKPPISDREALAMRNTSDATNEKIVSALGRQPKDPSEVNWEASITRYMRGDIKSSNPIMNSSIYETDVNMLKNAGLFSYDWNLVPFADKDSVVSWQSSKDGLYDKVVMRRDITWSDGKPFTAHDVAFSFRTIMNPDVPVPAVRSGTDQLFWVEAYDDYTVVFFHKRALATNNWNVNFPIIPKHIYEKSIKEDATLQNSPYHVQLENNPVCSGAYTITSRQRGQEIVMTRRDEYYIHDGKQVRDKPFFREVRFRIIPDTNTAFLALRGGDLDEMELQPEQWVDQTNDDNYYRNNTKVKGLEWTFYYFGWNCRRPYFTDRRVREAISYAFDHDEMLEQLLYGLNPPCTGMFHPASWMASKKPKKVYKQDFDRAEELLEAAGWTDSDGDGIRDKMIDGRRVKFEFTVVCTNTPERVRICNLLKQNLDQIGIICHVRPLEFAVLMELTQNKNFDAMFAGWGAGADPDTSENLWSTSAIDAGRNYVQYSNRYVDGLFELGKQVESATDQRERIWKEYNLADVGIQPSASRAEAYGKIDELVYADQPYTFLYYRSSFYGYNKAIRGYKFSPRGPYHYGPGFSAIWSAL